MHKLRFLLPALLLSSAALPLPADVFNAVNDFCATNSCHGFSYGTVDQNGSFLLFDVYTPNSIAGMSVSGVNSYSSSTVGSGYLPTVAKNTTGSTLNYANSVSQPANLLEMHPGSDGSFSVVQFTVPTTGVYEYSGIFQGIDIGHPGYNNGTSTDVVVTGAGNIFTSGSISSYGQQVTFGGTTSFAAGDQLYFIVGYGQDGNYFNDSTGFDVTLSQVPEPSAVMLLLTAIGGVAFLFNRKSARA